MHYDPLVTSAEPLVAVIREFLAGEAQPPHSARVWRVPACYEEHCAPDLADVARTKGLSISEVVRLHSEVRYHVYMVGFVPGYPYIGDLPAELALPRRTNPRVRVPAGSIAIATQMTAIYPIESPGGWHLIGATPVRLFDPSWERPALLSPGDAVQFEPISWFEYQRVRHAVTAGAYTVPCERLAS